MRQTDLYTGNSVLSIRFGFGGCGPDDGESSSHERETNEKLTELAEMAISAEVEHAAEQ
jgi:hypothetical protein